MSARNEIIEECAMACRAIQALYLKNKKEAKSTEIKKQWEDYSVGAGACAAELEALKLPDTSKEGETPADAASKVLERVRD